MAMMTMRGRVAVATLALCAAMASAGPSLARPIAGLYNTGVDNNGDVLIGAVQDSHYTLIWSGSPSPEIPYTGAVNGQFPIGYWVEDNTVSRWDTPTSNAADSFDPSSNGTYTYTTSFDLTAGQAAHASFAGQFAADNVMNDIHLNNTLIYAGPSDGSSQFSGWTSFDATSGFIGGVNTIRFVVENYAHNGGNPTGLNVEFTSSSAAPEPATWAMMGLGFVGLGLVGYRARRSIAAA